MLQNIKHIENNFRHGNTVEFGMFYAEVKP